MSTAKHKHEATERRLFDALENWFLNELDDDVVERALLTRVRLTTDRRQLTIYFATRGAGKTDADVAEVQEALETHVYAMGDVVEDELHGRRPELRLDFDRGAHNAARVERILGELQQGESGEGGAGDGTPEPHGRE